MILLDPQDYLTFRSTTSPTTELNFLVSWVKISTATGLGESGSDPGTFGSTAVRALDIERDSNTVQIKGVRVHNLDNAARVVEMTITKENGDTYKETVSLGVGHTWIIEHDGRSVVVDSSGAIQ